MPSTAQTLLTQAVGLGYDALSDRDLKESVLAIATTSPGTGGASDAQTLENLAASLKYGQLSQRGLMLSLAAVYAGSTTAQQSVVLGAQNHYAALSDVQLDEGLLALIS